LTGTNALAYWDYLQVTKEVKLANMTPDCYTDKNLRQGDAA